jgi:hypothetical protein
MERRVAQGRIVGLIFMNNAAKNRLALFLTTQTDLAVRPGLPLTIACALANASAFISLPVKRQPYSCAPISG